MPEHITHLRLVSVPVADVDRAKAFYVDTLGLRPDDKAQGEFWVGETCFGIYEPATFGMEFAPQTTAHLALHVDDMAEPIVASRSEKAILADVEEALTEAAGIPRRRRRSGTKGQEKLL